MKKKRMRELYDELVDENEILATRLLTMETTLRRYKDKYKTLENLLEEKGIYIIWS